MSSWHDYDIKLRLQLRSIWKNCLPEKYGNLNKTASCLYSLLEVLLYFFCNMNMKSFKLPCSFFSCWLDFTQRMIDNFLFFKNIFYIFFFFQCKTTDITSHACQMHATKACIILLYTTEEQVLTFSKISGDKSITTQNKNDYFVLQKNYIPT